MRLPVAAALIAAFSIAAPAIASSAKPVTVKLEKPVERASNNVVAAGVVWSCAGDTCVANIERRKPSPRDCGEVAREVGKVVSFTVNGAALDEAGITTCNRRAR